MRKNYIALALAAALGASSLGACTTNPATGLPAIDPTQITAIESQVQQTTAAVCGFVPTIETVASIIASFVPAGGAAVTVINAAATAICNAVAPAKAALLRSGTHKLTARSAPAVGIPSVNGIPIQGYFIK